MLMLMLMGYLRTLIILLAILNGGCIMSPAGLTVTSHPTKDSTSTASDELKRAWIFVDGSQQGTTPATIQIRRSYEISDISLRVGQNFDEVRRYELERSITSNRIMQDYTFQGSYDGGMLTFNSNELSHDRKGNYIIPFYQAPIQIIDHDYDLMLIISP